VPCQGDGSTGVRTQSWLFENWARTERRVIPTTYNPTNPKEIVAAVLDAERAGGSLKAVGSGWSYSQVAVDDSTTHVINTNLLTGLVGAEAVLPQALKAGLQPRARYFVEVKAGTKVHELNCLLDGLGLAMPTLGGSNGQSIAGAVSTGTHGADVNLPPIADCVRAIHLVGPAGQEWWIEPEGDRSITDPDQMQRARNFGPLCSEIRVDYDTLHFRSALVSLGRMGVIYSFVCEVVDAFLLTETHTASTWSAQQLFIRQTVQVPPAQYVAPRFLEIILNPYPQADGNHACVVTNREPGGTVPDPEKPPSKNTLQMFCDLDSVTQILVGVQLTLPGLIAAATAAAVASVAPLGAIPVVGPGLVAILTPTAVAAATTGLVSLEAAVTSLLAQSPGGNLADQIANVCNLASAVGQKQIVPAVISAIVPTFRDPTAPSQTRESFRILTGQGACGTVRPDDPPCMRSIDGIEIACDVSPGAENLFGFINEVLALTDMLYSQDTPVGYAMSLRFCTKTDAILGMQQFERTCSIEFMLLRGFVGLDTFKQRLFEIAQRHGAIPHWGLINQLPASQVRALYPELSTWRQSLQFLVDGGQGKAGTFRSNFSVARGLEPEAIQPPLVVVADDATGEAYPYDFGTCRLHDRKTVTFHFPNTGQGTLRVLSLTVDQDFRDQDVPASSFLGTPGRPHNIELTVAQAAALHGEEIRVTATFVAEESGVHTGSLTIGTNAGNIPTRAIKIPLHAMVEAVDVEVVQPASGAPLDLGPVGVGDYRLGTLVVRNAGTMAMTLDSFSLSNADLVPQLNVELGAVGVGQVRAYTVTLVPTMVGALTTDLTLHFTDGISPSRVSQDVTLGVTATGLGAQAGLSPPELDFGSAVIGTTAPPQTVQIENAGQQALTITGSLIGGDFMVRDPLPPGLAPGQSLPVVLQFRPGHDGPLVSSFSVSSNSAQPPTPIVLQGVGIARPLLGASPDSLAFPDTPVGARSAERVVVIQNQGAVPVKLEKIHMAGADAADFRIAGSTCAGALLTPEQRCEVHIVMAPASAGAKQATLEVMYAGPDSPLQVPLTGAAEPAQGLVPSTSGLDFGPVPLGTTSGPLQVSIRNSGTAVANVQSVSIAGADAGDFAIVSDACTGTALAPGDACTLDVSTSPQTAGALTADLALTADTPAYGVSLAAQGVAAQMQWSSTGLDFGPIHVGGRSPRQDVQLFNTGQVTLVVTSIDIQGDFEFVDIVPTINTVPPNQAKYFHVWLVPTAAGAMTGSLTVHCAAPGGTYSLALTGSGSP